MSKNSSAKLRVVFDSNVFIASFLRPGLSNELLQKVSEGLLKLFISEEIISEISQKLKNKMKVKEEDITRFIFHIRTIADTVLPAERIFAVKRDPDDNKILECAIEAKVNLIVSLDQDLIKLKEYNGIAIIHPKTFCYITTEK